MGTSKETAVRMRPSVVLCMVMDAAKPLVTEVRVASVPPVLVTVK